MFLSEIEIILINHMISVGWTNIMNRWNTHDDFDKFKTGDEKESNYVGFLWRKSTKFTDLTHSYE